MGAESTFISESHPSPIHIVTTALASRQTRCAPEMQALLLCARLMLQDEETQQLQDLLSLQSTGALLNNHGFNWDVFYTLASRHGLLPLVHWQWMQLSEHADLIPSHVRAEFHREFEENAARNFTLIAELLHVMKELEAAGVQAAVYKGPALALLAYDNLLLRHFGDLDLLVAPHALPQAQKVLLRLGYSQQFHSNRDANEYAYSFQRPQDENAASNVNRGTIIELHWGIAPHNYALPLHPPDALRRLHPLTLGSQQIWTLAPEDHLIAACWHGYKHRWWRLEWIVAIAEILRRFANPPQSTSGLDWSAVLERATLCGSRRMLFCGLGLARELMDAPLPEPIEKAMVGDRGLPLLLDTLCNPLLQMPATRDTRFFHLRSRERLRDKLRYSWRTGILQLRTWHKPLETP
jgi:hypothetical protein